MNSSSWTDIDDIVTLPHDIFIMFNHDHRISDFSQTLQVLDEHTVITGVKSDRWFIEDVDNPLESCPDLRGETDTLRLTT